MKKIFFAICLFGLFFSAIGQELVEGSEFRLTDKLSVIIYSASSYDDVRELGYSFTLSVYKDIPKLVIEDEEGDPVYSREFKESYLVFGNKMFMIVSENEAQACVMLKDGKWCASLNAVPLTD